jgi:hypothetical protein
MALAVIRSSAAPTGSVIRDVGFAVKLYAFAAVAGVAISFGSSLLGHPLVTFSTQAAPQATQPSFEPAAVQPAVTPVMPETKPWEDLLKSIDVEVARREPKEKVNQRLHVVFDVVYPDGGLTLTSELKVDEVVPFGVSVRPLPAGVQSALEYVGVVPDGRQANSVIRYYIAEATRPGRYTDDQQGWVILDHSHKVVGVFHGKMVPDTPNK